MAKNKVSKVTEVKPAKRKKTEEKPEAVYIYHKGDDLSKISEALTGKNYLIMRVLQHNDKDINDLKDGDILKWEI